MGTSVVFWGLPSDNIDELKQNTGGSCRDLPPIKNTPKEIHGFLDNWLNQVFSANIEKIKVDEVMAQPALGVTWDILRFWHLPNGSPDHLS